MMVEPRRRWWQRIQWTDVVLVIVAVVVLLMLTMELWLPHFGPE
jgi:hypothetical protein